MPASFGIERPHLHCTSVHNKGLQTPTSPCARAQSKTCMHQEDTRAPACTRQETHASPLHASKRCVRHSLACVQDISTPFLLACMQRCTRHSTCARPRHARAIPPCVRPKMAAPTGARAKMHAPLLLATQRCARLSSYERCCNTDILRSWVVFDIHSQDG